MLKNSENTKSTKVLLVLFLFSYNVEYVFMVCIVLCCLSSVIFKFSNDEKLFVAKDL